MNVDQELKDYLLVLWRFKWLILICTIVSCTVAVVLSLIITPKYKAVAIVRVLSTPGGASDYTYIGSLTRLTNTYVEIANSDLSLDEVATRLGLIKRPKIEVEVVSETELLKISTSNPDPVLARDIANTLANILVEQSLKLYGGDVPTAREILEDQLQQAKADLDTAVNDYEKALLVAQLSNKTQTNSTTPKPNLDLETLSHIVYVRQQIYGDLLQQYETARTNEQLRVNAITLIEPAKIPEKQDSPKLLLNSVLGLIAGLLFGVILAFIVEGLDDSLHNLEDVQAITQLPILGLIPELKTKSKINVGQVTFPNGKLTTIPSFDQLRTRILQSAATDVSPLKILITSPEPGTGKSTVASNLAISLTKGGKRVILIDMDLRRPVQHTIFGIPNKDGLSDYLKGNKPLEDVLLPTKIIELQIITAGTVDFDPFVLFSVDNLDKLFGELSRRSDYLVIDSPALLSVADPMVLATKVDELILVVTRYKTERRNLQFTIHQLENLDANITGIVINRMKKDSLYQYYSYP